MADIVMLMQKQPDFYAMKGASEEEIRMAEQTLGLCFAADYRKYIAAYGVASFAGHELTGICKSKRLSVIDVTIEERNNIPVPTDWYVLEQANIDGIVIWQDSNGTVYQTAPNTKAKKCVNRWQSTLNINTEAVNVNYAIL